MPRSGIVDRVLSTTFIAALLSEEQDIVRAEVESTPKTTPR
jgi:hypothetical protein